MTDSGKHEGREFTRAPVVVEAQVESDGATMTGKVANISLNGVLLHCEPTLAVGARCTVVLTLEGGGPDARIVARGTVARSDATALAVQFEEIVDTNSYWHLRNLVLYNAADPGQVEAEFAAHLGIKRRDED